MKCANVRLLGGGGGLESWRADALPASLHTVLIYFYMCVCVWVSVFGIFYGCTRSAFVFCIIPLLLLFFLPLLFPSLFFRHLFAQKKCAPPAPVPATRGRWQRSRRFQLLCFVFSLVANLFEYVCVWERERECVQWVLSLSLCLHSGNLWTAFVCHFIMPGFFFGVTCLSASGGCRRSATPLSARPLPACLHPSPH